MAEPILRWAGGKRQLIDEIIPRLPPKTHFNDYYEPFFGGGAVFFNLAPSNGNINDINEPLMNFYRLFRDDIDHIVHENKKLDDELDRYDSDYERKRFYYTRRREFNELHNGDAQDEIREAVLFLFLNRTCWNGLYRTNEDGDFNVPMKSKVIDTVSIEPKLREGHRALQNTIITSKDFISIRDEVEKKDLVFLDPPYVQESDAKQFDEYSPGGFNSKRQEEVRNLALELHKRGAYVMITNSFRAKDLYTRDRAFAENFRIKPIKAKRTINSDSSQRVEIGHTDLIVTNIPTFSEQKDFDDFR